MCKKCCLKVSSAFKLKILAEKTHFKLLAILPSAGNVGNATGHAPRITEVDSTGLERSFTKHNGGITFLAEGFTNINAGISITNIGASLTKLKESCNKLDDNRVCENEIMDGTGEIFDNLKIEYEDETFNHSDGKSGTTPVEEIIKEENIPEDSLTGSDDENIPLASVRSMDRCRKRKIMELDKIQCGKCEFINKF